MSVRYLSWHALQAAVSGPSRALTVFRLLVVVAASNPRAALWNAPSLAAKSCGFCQIAGLAPVFPTSGPLPRGNQCDARSASSAICDPLERMTSMLGDD